LIAWLKRSVSAIAVGALAFLAYRAAQQVSGHKRAAERWQRVAIDNEQADVSNSIVSAEAAISQAMKHEQEAKRIKRKAQDRIDKVANSDETIRSIVDNWRAP
jgi:hypothetical protein